MARRTLTELYNEIANKFPDNTEGLISAAAIRSVTTDIVDSAFSRNSKVIDELADLGTPVGGYYELSAGYYIFNTSLDLGTNGIKLTDTDGFYYITSNRINTVAYTGTNPFIVNSSTGTVLLLKEVTISTPNATAIEMTNGNSLISSIVVFSGCKKTIDLTSFEFFTSTDGIAMVGCESGATLDNIERTSIDRPQWNDGQDLNGIFFEITGASSELFVATVMDTEMTSTEAVFDIDATFGGVVSISGGAHLAGDFFTATSRKQDDASVLVSDVSGVFSSNTLGAVYITSNTAETTISVTDIWYDFNLNALAILGSDSERFELVSSTTGEMRYIGKEPFSGSIQASLSSLGAGSVSEYHFRAIKNGVTPFPPIAKNQIDSTMSSTSLHSQVKLVTNDTVKLQVLNHTNTSNIVMDTISINVNR